MKILALEKEVEGTSWENTENLLELEARHIFDLYLGGSLREIYFTEARNAVLILETNDKKTAEELLNNFPLVKSNRIRFEISELRPYTGYERLIKNSNHIA